MARRKQTKRPRRRQLCLEQLDPRLMLSVNNGDFDIVDVQDPGFSWETTGDVTVESNVAVLRETEQPRTGLSQTFTIPAGAQQLTLTLVDAQLDASPLVPPDFLEVALTDAATGLSLIPTADGLPDSDAFLNINAVDEVFFGTGVAVPGAVQSGAAASLTFPLTVDVDLTGVAAGTSASLFVDLIGFGEADSTLRVDNVFVFGDLPPRLSVNLDPSVDSGALGDLITNVTAVDFVGKTAPNLEVLLDLNGDGFDDGTAQADGGGDFRFDGITLPAGSSTLRWQTSNSFGVTEIQRELIVDASPPTGALTRPTENGTTAEDTGSVEIQWTDPGDAGIDPASYDTTDISIAGLTIDRIIDLGNGRVEYHYGDDNDLLTPGDINVTLHASAVSDRAGNATSESVQSFTFTGVPPQVAFSGDTAGFEGTEVAVIATAIDRFGSQVSEIAWTVLKSGTPFTSGNGSQIRFTPDDDADYLIEVVATDAFDQTGQNEITIAVANVAPTPSISGPATGIEDQIVSLVGSATDPAGDNDEVTLQWSVAVNGSQVASGSGAAIDFTPLVPGDFMVTLTATDDANASASIERTVSVANVNDPPSEVQLSSLTVGENQPGGTVGMLTVVDPDEQDTHTYTLSDSRFEVVQDRLKLRNDVTLNHEEIPSISLTITATDSATPGLSVDQTFTIEVADENEFAPQVDDADFEIDEHRPAGTIAGTVNATDNDTSQMLSYAISAGDDQMVFAIDSSGVLTVANSELLNFEASSEFTLTVDVTDSGVPSRTSQATVTVTLRDINDPPDSVDVDNLSVRENISGETVGAISVSDQDPGDTHTLTLEGDRFEVVDGVLKLKTDVSLSLDDGSEVQLPVEAVDSNDAKLETTLTITVLPNPFPWQNPDDDNDSNDDTLITSNDVLVIINELNDPQVSVNNVLPRSRPANSTLPYFDVTGDGLVSPFDVLFVINFINQQG